MGDVEELEVTDQGGFESLMVEARSALLRDPGGGGEGRARLLIRKYLFEACTPPEVLWRAEEYFLDLAYRGCWAPRPIHQARPPISVGIFSD